MPRYYFDVEGLPPDADAVGEELEGDEAAWEEATEYAGQLIRDIDGKMKPGQEWRLVVSDSDRNRIYIVEVKSQKLK